MMRDLRVVVGIRDTRVRDVTLEKVFAEHFLLEEFEIISVLKRGISIPLFAKAVDEATGIAQYLATQGFGAELYVGAIRALYAPVNEKSPYIQMDIASIVRSGGSLMADKLLLNPKTAVTMMGNELVEKEAEQEAANLLLHGVLRRLRSKIDPPRLSPPTNL